MDTSSTGSPTSSAASDAAPVMPPAQRIYLLVLLALAVAIAAHMLNMAGMREVVSAVDVARLTRVEAGSRFIDATVDPAKRPDFDAYERKLEESLIRAREQAAAAMRFSSMVIVTGLFLVMAATALVVRAMAKRWPEEMAPSRKPKGGPPSASRPSDIIPLE